MVEWWSATWAFFEHAPFHVRRPGWLSRHDRNMTLSREVVRERVKPTVAEEHWLAAVRQRLQPLHPGQQGHLHRREPPVVVAASSAATRASISSISMALAAWLNIASAARTRTDAGVAGSIIVFNKVVAAAEVPCWSRAMAWPNAVARFPVGCLELGEFHPIQQRVGRDAGRLGGFLDIALRKQGGDGLFLLALELGTVAFHWTHPGTICRGSTPAVQSPFRLPADSACLFPRPE